MAVHMTNRTKKVFENDDVRIDYHKRNGRDHPSRYEVVFLSSGDYFDLDPEELFMLQAATSSVCNSLSDRGLSEHVGK